MSQFIDMLKERLVNAQSRFQEKQLRLQQAQAEHQMVAQEVASLTTLINLETAREQQKALQEHRPPVPRPVISTAPQPVHPVPLPAQAVPPGPTQAQPIAASGAMSASGAASSESKTEVIRDILRKHTNGITPAQVWVLVRESVERPYLYSILKRMKDRGEVEERAGKYYLQVGKQEEVRRIQ